MLCNVNAQTELLEEPLMIASCVDVTCCLGIYFTSHELSEARGSSLEHLPSESSKSQTGLGLGGLFFPVELGARILERIRVIDRLVFMSLMSHLRRVAG